MATAVAAARSDRGFLSLATNRSAIREGELVEQVLFWTLVGGLAWCPFLFGSNTPLAWGINAILFCGLAIAYEIALIVRAKSHPIGIRQLALPAGIFGAVLLWALVQNANWTPVSLHHPIWKMASEALERPIAGSISANRDLTMLAILRLVTAASVFWMTLQLCRSPYRAALLLRAIVVIVTLYAAYGLISFAMMPGRVLWLENRPMLTYLTSTFFNRNHFATYAGIGLVATLGFILQLCQREIFGVAAFRLRFAGFIEAFGQKEGAILLSSAFIITVALLATGSRGGVIASVAGVVVACTLLMGRTQHGSAEHGVAAIILVIVGIVTFAVFGNLFFDRLGQGGLEGRFSAYAITLRSIWDASLLGYGYGTFEDVFPMFRDRTISVLGVWDAAHNTYLEIFQGLGIIFGAMMVICLILLAIRCLRGARSRRQKLVPAVATGAAIIVGTHAFIDFSLQIQAVTLTFIAILAAGVAQSESSRAVLSD